MKRYLHAYLCCTVWRNDISLIFLLLLAKPEHNRFTRSVFGRTYRNAVSIQSDIAIVVVRFFVLWSLFYYMRYKPTDIDIASDPAWVGSRNNVSRFFRYLLLYSPIRQMKRSTVSSIHITNRKIPLIQHVFLKWPIESRRICSLGPLPVAKTLAPPAFPILDRSLYVG